MTWLQTIQQRGQNIVELANSETEIKAGSIIYPFPVSKSTKLAAHDTKYNPIQAQINEVK